MSTPLPIGSAMRSKWAEFRRRYFEELHARQNALHPILERVRSSQVTFVFASRESRFYNAVALKEYVERLIRVSPR